MDLIERLEAAQKGSRTLDSDIAVMVGYRDWTVDEWEAVKRDPNMIDPSLPGAPPYTTSLDAALSLVPEGHTFMLRGPRTSAERWSVDLVRTNISTEYGSGFAFVGEPIPAATPALALCIAALKARQSQEAQIAFIDEEMTARFQPEASAGDIGAGWPKSSQEAR